MAQTTHKGVTVRDVSAQDFITSYAKFLKKSGKIELPQWADVVKTGTHKQLAPLDADWFYVRAASVARQVYLQAGRGVGSMKKVYGGPKKIGFRPAHFTTGSGSVVQAVFKQLENLKVIEKDPKGGRRITSTGARDLDRIAGQIVNKTKQ